MKKPKVPQGMKTDGTPVIVCTSEPITRRLKNGAVLWAVSELARQELSPMLIIDALEAEWRRT